MRPCCRSTTQRLMPFHALLLPVYQRLRPFLALLLPFYQRLRPLIALLAQPPTTPPLAATACCSFSNRLYLIRVLRKVRMRVLSSVFFEESGWLTDGSQKVRRNPFADRDLRLHLARELTTVRCPCGSVRHGGGVHVLTAGVGEADRRRAGLQAANHGGATRL